MIRYFILISLLIRFSICSDPNSCWKKRANSEECYHDQEKAIEDLDNLLSQPNSPYKVVVVTVASNATDGYVRYLRSARLFDIPVRILGLNQPWRGGAMTYPGGGQKVNLLRTELIPFQDDSETIILFTDSYDVVFLANLDEIVNRFLRMDTRMLFSAEAACWPDRNLASKYPAVAKGQPYLNSGGFMGFASDVFSVLSFKDIADNEDDQLYYTKVYLDENMRKTLQIKLDHNSEIFQNLNGALNDVDLKWQNNEAQLVNTVSNTKPAVVHGNGYSKIILNSLTNYIPKAWVSGEGCIACKEDIIKLDREKESHWPRVLVSVFINKPTPFLEEFFDTFKQLKYPRNRLDFFIYNSVEGHEIMIDSFVKSMDVRSFKRIGAKDDITDVKARSLAVDHYFKKGSEYFLSVDGEARLDNPNSLRLLIEQNRGVVSPMLVRPYKAWSNFWGALSDDGYYARSPDYMDIVNNVKRGLWNVPYIMGCYLINGTVMNNPNTKPSFISDGLDQDMAFSRNMRNNGVFMYISNRVDFGHLINTDDFSLENMHPDFYNLYQNQWDWEQRYIHENYSQNLNLSVKPMEPCPDVFWFPVTTERFCNELIAIMENFGKWSDGSNQDTRLNTGYEAVPTRDIHMNQVGLETQWLLFLKLFVLPLNNRAFFGYPEDAPRSLMNFIVRYRPDEQPSLRPHFDSSTYTINIALNRPHIDYEGGGCNFIRYNCSVVDTRQGWLLIHPGRLTHFHEGLRVTNGTRYIMISFIDP